MCRLRQREEAVGDHWARLTSREESVQVGNETTSQHQAIPDLHSFVEKIYVYWLSAEIIVFVRFYGFHLSSCSGSKHYWLAPAKLAGLQQ